MLRNKPALIGLYFVTLVCVCGITLVGPAVGGSITNLGFGTLPNDYLACKTVSLGSLTGTNVVVQNVGVSAPSNFEYGIGLWTDDNSLVKLLFDGDCVGATCTGSLAFNFSFDYAGGPSTIDLGLTGTSNGISGLFGLFYNTGDQGLCTSYATCVSFGDGAINTSASPYLYNGTSPVTGTLYLANLTQSLIIGANSGDIQFSGVPEPSSFVLLAIGLGALTWLRRRIHQIS